MAIPIEGWTVVAKKEVIEPHLDSGAIDPPNATALSDDHIWRCSFMTRQDADRFLEQLVACELEVARGPDPAAVIVDEFEQEVEPYCEWLATGAWENAVIAWKAGSPPRTVVAREGWDPKVGSGLNRRSRADIDKLEFVRLDGQTEVYRDPETGQELYVGRTTIPVEALFRTAAETIQAHCVNPGHSAVEGDAAAAVQEALTQLDQILTEHPDWWNALWFHGKGHVALGNLDAAYASLRHAYEVEREQEVIPRELAGVCLALGRFDEAVEVSQRAVTLRPDDAESLGNYAVSCILAARLEPARKAIDAALARAPDDSVNRTIEEILTDIETGRRPQPSSMEELMRPTPAPREPDLRTKGKKPFWKFW